MSAAIIRGCRFPCWESGALLWAVALIAMPSRARAFERATVADGGACLFWGTRRVDYRINNAGLSTMPFSQVKSAIDQGFDAWMGWPCSDFTFVDLGPTADQMVGYNRVLVSQPALAPDVPNTHLVVFRESSCEAVAPPNDDCWDAKNDDCDNKYNCWQGGEESGDALAFTLVTSLVSTGRILDADTEFDAFDYEFQDLATTGCDGRVDSAHCADLQNTMAHEAGHFLGLAHSGDANATMYFEVTQVDETSKRDLDRDDVNGLCTIYPTGKPTVTCAQGQVEVFAQGCGCTGAPDAIDLWGLLVALQLARSRRVF